jgi:hypothetical protein
VEHRLTDRSVALSRLQTVAHLCGYASFGHHQRATNAAIVAVGNVEVSGAIASNSVKDDLAMPG